MTKLETYSHNGGREILDEKGITEQIHEIPRIWSEYPSQYDHTERTAAFSELGNWETETQIDLGPEEEPHSKRLTPFLDAYNPEYNVAVEHEKKEQMRARWHLMKIQAASQRFDSLDIDVGVLIYPTDRDPSLRRTRREIQGPFFSKHFPIHLPVYAIEYSTESD